VAQLLQLNEVVFSSAVTLNELGRLTAALLPHFLVLAIPLAYMLGLQLALGRMAIDREIIALTAAGTPLRRLYRVPVVVAVALGFAVAALAAWAEPWGLREVTRVLNEVIKRNLQTGLLSGVFNEGLPRFTVYVADVTPTGAWRGVLIDDQLGDGAPILALAEEGTITDAGGDARGFAYLVTLFSFTAYYVAGRIGVALAEKHVPVLLAAFLPNLMVLAIGVVLSVRLARRGVPLVRG